MLCELNSKVPELKDSPKHLPILSKSRDPVKLKSVMLAEAASLRRCKSSYTPSHKPP